MKSEALWKNKVTKRTPLTDLVLSWDNSQLPQRERTKHVHSLHPFLGKFVPQLAEVFLRKFFVPGNTVFDPFSGSGTTLVQALELGVDSVGCDVSAWGVLLTRAKTRQYNMERLTSEVESILADTMASDRYYTISNSYLSAWFAPQALSDLLTFRRLIGNYHYRNLLRVILSRAARSARLVTHHGLEVCYNPKVDPYWCYKHKRICAPPTTAKQFIKQYCRDTLKRVEQFAQLRQPRTTTLVLHETSQHVNPGAVSGVLTSPPYVGIIDYHEQHRYAYELFGLSDWRDFEIGAAAGGVSARAKLSYQHSIAAVFSNAARFMPVGGPLIVVAGDKYDLFPAIAEECRFRTVATLERAVTSRTGLRRGNYCEKIFVWRTT